MKKNLWMICLALCLSACAGAEETMSIDGMIDVKYKKEDLSAEWKQEEAVRIDLSGDGAQIDGKGARMDGGVLVIDEKGDYLLTGEFSGRIVVDAEDEKVRLILNGADIVSEDSAAIFIFHADKATLVLAEGSRNRIVSGTNRIYEADEELDAAVYSKADLVINGTGSLTVEAPDGHGILSKDDLRIIEGNITVCAAEDGLRGRDAVLLYGGKVEVSVGGDGVRSNNDKDEKKGYVSVDGGEISISSGGDGIQAETVLQLRGGSVSVNAGTEDSMSLGESCKGMKAGKAVLATGGTISIDSMDDSLHSDGDILIAGGDWTLKSGDDGIHADETLEILDGRINVVQSYEGVEGLNVRISGGEVSVVSEDDGINAAGGDDDNSSKWKDMFTAGDHELCISGGVVYINAGGDGVDSNGTLSIEGGELYISGPTDDGDGALDASGEMTVSGGVLMACGSSGMAAAPSSNGQEATMITLKKAQDGGKTVSVRNAAGEELASFTPEKRWSNLVVSIPNIQKGEEIQVFVDGERLASASVGDGTGAGGMRGHGNRDW